MYKFVLECFLVQNTSFTLHLDMCDFALMESVLFMIIVCKREFWETTAKHSCS